MKSNISEIASQPLHYVRKSNEYRESQAYEATSKIKQEQRDKILKVIFDNHQQNVKFKYLGLPGKAWIFERMLDQANNQMNIITGIERDLKIFHHAKMVMPGWGLCDKSKDIHGSKLDIFRTSRSNYICGDLVSLTDETTINELGDFTENKNKSGTLVRGLTNNTAIWYDFTAPFGKDTYQAIYNIKNVAISGAVVCLTLMYGRDMYFNGPGEESRVDIIKRALPGFDLIDVWTYKGFNDTPMINICGVIGGIG